MKAKWVRGDLLPQSVQRMALGHFVHRHTGEHPALHMRGAQPEFATDAEWLAHHYFAVTDSGWYLDRRVNHCEARLFHE